MSAKMTISAFVPKLGLWLAPLLALVVVGCSSVPKAFDNKAQERNPAPCPNVLVLPEASRVIKFNGEKTLENVAWTGEILGISTTCRYYDDNPIEAEVTVDFAFGRGPMADSNQTQMKYFIAVTRTNRDLIAKEEFVLPVKFKGNKTTVQLSDNVQKILIPRKDENISGVNFEIVIGFSLSRDEVIYNRSGKSLRFPDL